MLATGGSVAFFALLAAFPGVTTIVSIYGLMADPNIVDDHLRVFVGILPRDALDLLADQMNRIAGQSADTLGVAFLVSLAVALWSANSGVAALFDALNVVYKEREKRSLLRFYGTTFLFTLGAVGFVVAAITGVVALPIALNVVGLGGFTESLLSFSRWPVLLAGVAGLAGAGLSLRTESPRAKMAVGYVGQYFCLPAVDQRLHAVLMVRRQLRQLQSDLRLCRRGGWFHDLDLAVGGHRADRSGA